MGSGVFIAHYLNDRSSLEFQGPLLDGGPEFYGFLWFFFELLGDAPDHRLSVGQLKAIAHQCFSTPERVKAFIVSALEAGLFKREGEWIWCDELNRRFSHALDAMPMRKRKEQARIIDTVKRGVEKEYPADFEDFWAAYPRKEGKVKAYEQFMINLKNGCSAQEMMQSARKYAKARVGEDTQFTLMPSTFLGPSQRWREYIASSRQAAAVAEKPKEELCPVCGAVLAVSTASSCLKCWFPLTDAKNKEKVEAYKREYEKPFVSVDPNSLMEMIRQKMKNQGKVIVNHG
ncbi:hypothetical protein TRIP_E230121 [uncultured Spirochaetota bacterium]|uniref:Lin1244/Lin1753-like N-terminal domain-containing protein n=1 Tax=uncultured Spirochaetota bacterium TaxID=460511 RepID=A0A652ZVV9_9SPIR|nr:hypothetical protein TRIP_E230121 [uncultured Spirochaetota bacterium]